MEHDSPDWGLLPAPPPGRDEVLRQGFRFKPVWWKRRLPPTWWPSQLDALPPHGDDSEYRYITRADVFAIARVSDSPPGLVQLLVAAYVWGTGDLGFLVGRRSRVFTYNSRRVVEKRLQQAADHLQSFGAADAYRLLSRKSTGHLPYLGPSFFTKLLYFFGWDQTPDGIQPLILDRFVAIGINDMLNLGWSESGSWSADEYAEYLSVAGKAGDGSADTFEMRLFERGKQVWRARRKLTNEPR